MPKSITMTAMLILVGVTGALAQTSTGRSNNGPVIVQPGAANAPDTLPPGVPGLRQRQPRRGDLPPGDAQNITNIDPEDAALDRKIRSICRGC